MNGFLHAVAFLTRLPVPAHLKEEGRTGSILWYPVVGLLLGAILSLFDMFIAGRFPAPVRAVLDVIAWVWLTGGLHLDGLMDTADGLGAWRETRKTLEIMKDSRVGAMGVLAGVCAVLLKVSLVYSLPGSDPGTRGVALMCACVTGRYAAVWGMYFFPYVSPGGSASGLKESLNVRRFAWVSVSAALPVTIQAGWTGLVAAAAALIFNTFFGRRVTGRIGGLTGDLYGAMVEMSELAVLMTFVLAGETG